MKAHPPVPGETRAQRRLRKADDMRAAFIECGFVKSPDPELAFVDLPPARQQKWLRLAESYIEIFG